MAIILNKTFYIDINAATMGNGLTPETPFNRLSPYSSVNGWWPGFGGGNDYQGCKFLVKTNTTHTTRNLYGTSNDFSALRWELGSTDATNPVLLSYYGDGILPTVNASPIMPKIIGNSDTTATGVASTAVATGIFVNAKNVIVDHFDISNMRLNNVLNTAADAAVETGVVVQNCYIHDSQYYSGSNESGLYLYGGGIKALNNKFERIGVDAIWMNGARATAMFNDITQVGMFGSDGDGIQFSGYSSDIVCTDNSIDHSTYDSKHCIIISTVNPGISGGLIARNNIQAYYMPSVNIGIYVASDDVAVIGNRVENGWHSLVINSETNTSTAMNTLVVGNLFINPRYNNIEFRNDGAKTSMEGVVIKLNTMVRGNTETGRNYNKSLGSVPINTASPADISHNIFINNGSTGSKYNLISEFDTIGDNLYYSTVSGMTPIYSYGTGGAITKSAGSLQEDPFLDADFSLTAASPIELIGTCSKFWEALLPITVGLTHLQSPCDAKQKPIPDSYIDWGGVQSTLHAKHPKNVFMSGI